MLLAIVRWQIKYHEHEGKSSRSLINPKSEIGINTLKHKHDYSLYIDEIMNIKPSRSLWYKTASAKSSKMKSCK